MPSVPSQVPTSAVTFIETEHGRLRRAQRGIDKKDLQAARKYGDRQDTHPRPNGDQTAIYTYNGIVYIVNEITGEEVTSYTLPLALSQVPVTEQQRREHVAAAKRIQQNLNLWTSNTVLIVDTSGSMRSGDVWGAKTRLSAVWIAVALDFVAQRLEGDDAGHYDVVSIVSLGEKAKIIVREQPTSWILYNEIIKLYTWEAVNPYGHGMYIPSLRMAEKLLCRNSNASCALGLCFLSDGIPSDFINIRDADPHDSARAVIKKQVEKLACRFGRRLTFSAIGMGNSDDFDTLKEMVDAANEYHSIGIFQLPSLTTSGLGNAFSSVATSVTTTQTEITDLGVARQRNVRDVMRESKTHAMQRTSLVDYVEFWTYRKQNVWRSIYREREVEDKSGRKRHKGEFQKVPLLHPEAGGVALCKRVFGEGAERVAYRFFEVASDQRTVLGGAMVAKESRFVVDTELGDEEKRQRYVQTFCSTQQLAKRIANEFNEMMDSVPRIDRTTPRVTFLDCSIYHLADTNLGENSILVEPQINHMQWKKWNSNNGFVEGQSKDTVKKNEIMAFDKLQVGFDVIEEGSEGGEDDDSQYQADTICFTASEVAQAFSHFSYWATGRKRLICDLQGEYDEEANILRLSDPVIHYYNQKRVEMTNIHGRTDLGRKGMKAFLRTHECSKLCALVTEGFRKAHHRRKNTKK